MNINWSKTKDFHWSATLYKQHAKQDNQVPHSLLYSWRVRHKSMKGIWPDSLRTWESGSRDYCNMTRPFLSLRRVWLYITHNLRCGCTVKPATSADRYLLYVGRDSSITATTPGAKMLVPRQAGFTLLSPLGFVGILVGCSLQMSLGILLYGFPGTYKYVYISACTFHLLAVAYSIKKSTCLQAIKLVGN